MPTINRTIASSLFALVAFSLLSFNALFGAESRRVGLLLDEPAVVPMRVEADIMVDVARELVAADSLTLLAPSDAGVVDRSGAAVDLNAFDLLWIYQGDAIVQDSALFSDATVAQLRAFVDSAPSKGVLLTGGSVALFDKLGYEGALTIAPLTFGEDRAQSGLIPIAENSTVFEGVDLDRNIGWITNAGFPAFANFASQAPNVVALAQTPEGGEPNPLLVGLSGPLDGETPNAKVVAFGWRVNPLLDRAPETYRTNFKRLLANLLGQTGAAIVTADLVAPTFALPNFDALQRALDYYAESFDESEYPNGADFQSRLDALRERGNALNNDDVNVADAVAALQADFDALQREALLASPELDFDEFLYIKRDPKQMGLPENYNSNSVLPPLGYVDELRRFNFRTNETALVYKPEHGEFVGDLELYYDASKVMFSSPDVNAENRWRLWELPLDAEDAAPILTPLINENDVDNYDACYLPDDRVVFCSTASMTGVPCINGSGHVCNLYIKELDGSIRQLTIEQDHDWNPVVMNNGRIMYLRWEYVDLPHCFSRIMFHANPDGTNQSELYGSGSYWPNSVFYARPMPGDSGKFVGIVTGHHEQNRVGDLVIFDPSLGRKEASGAVQRIPGWGKKVEPIACDLPIAQNWPKFLYPFPISDTTLLVSCKRSASTPWEICLVDVFDNISTLVKLDGDAALEPIPLRETERQPILPDRIEPSSKTADVFIADIYEGEGLKGIPRGDVKALRIFSYEFAYQGMGAEPYSVGLDGPWDPRRIIGTVPVNEDGSASFKIPAYAPIALQPLDKDGKALQIMRSWITAMPGETVSCVGCHEMQNSTSSTAPRAVAGKSTPVEIAPFYGETRGFSFEREIQPIIDQYCLDCHRKDSPKIASMIADGQLAPEIIQSELRPNQTFEDSLLPDFSKSEPRPALANAGYIAQESPFSNGYYQLRRYVRTPTKESEMPTHLPYEFAADTTYLVQLLQAGHYGVKLDPESWDKLTTWIDLNAPYNGSWGEILRNNQALVKSQQARRDELRGLYAPSSEPIDDDPNVPIEPVQPTSTLRVQFTETKEADLEMERSDSTESETFSVALADGVALEMTKIPGAKFSIGRFEITNEQYKAFDPSHDSGLEYGDFIQFSPGERGWSLDRPRLPVARVTWNDAQKFCEWLSEKTGDEYRLPTEQEWKYAASGAQFNPFWFGDPSTDYAPFENLADLSNARISPIGWTGRVDVIPEWRPVDFNRDDHSRLASNVGSYQPNLFGLFDVQGNVSEWTSSNVVLERETRAAAGSQGDVVKTAKKVVCGGSWTTPARKATLESTRAYPPQYALRDVGFRVLRVERD